MIDVPFFSVLTFNLSDVIRTFILGAMNTDNYATWLEIDLGAIESNYKELQKIACKPVMPVIKANAYGHGLEETAKKLDRIGVEWCGVARIEEALLLRDLGIGMKILVLGYTSPLRIHDALRESISLAVYDFSVAKAYSNQVKGSNHPLRLHAKIDTGMGRLGIPSEDAVRFIELIKNTQGFELEGCFTHFACADEQENPLTDEQLARFEKILNELDTLGIRPSIVHAANSAATLYHSNARFDMVRCGIALYGLPPSSSKPLPTSFTPVMSWKTRLISLKNLPKGHGVSYGVKYHTSRDERIGVIAAGYGDGLRRRPGNHMLLRGKRVPVVGNVCMDQCMLQLDNVPEAQIGDEVVLIGNQGEEEITVTDIANDWGTINYEVTCGMAARMPRRYFG
ncbi:MAG TPA: alanine racemase [Anaerolineae bacterium]|nr:alanine racemase [Anaerolineae bacterium]